MLPNSAGCGSDSLAALEEPPVLGADTDQAEGRTSRGGEPGLDGDVYLGGDSSTRGAATLTARVRGDGDVARACRGDVARAGSDCITMPAPLGETCRTSAGAGTDCRPHAGLGLKQTTAAVLCCLVICTLEDDICRACAGADTAMRCWTRGTLGGGEACTGVGIAIRLVMSETSGACSGGELGAGAAGAGVGVGGEEKMALGSAGAGDGVSAPDTGCTGLRRLVLSSCAGSPSLLDVSITMSSPMSGHDDRRCLRSAGSVFRRAGAGCTSTSLSISSMLLMVFARVICGEPNDEMIGGAGSDSRALIESSGGGVASRTVTASVQGGADERPVLAAPMLTLVPGESDSNMLALDTSGSVALLRPLRDQLLKAAVTTAEKDVACSMLSGS